MRLLIVGDLKGHMINVAKLAKEKMLRFCIRLILTQL